MIDAMKQALAKFERLWEIGIDVEYKVELLPEIRILRQAIEQAEQWDTSDMAYRSGGLSVEQEKMCVDCGKPTMHMGNKCYGCCQTTQPEQAEKQEPVARFNWNEAKFEWLTEYNYEKHHMKPLYLAPAKREWVGLTDEEVHKIIDDCTSDEAELEELIDFSIAILAVEAKLKERNK
jgi:hypothetical protein